MTKLNIKLTLYFILSLYTFKGYPVKVLELKKGVKINMEFNLRLLIRLEFIRHYFEKLKSS